MSFGAMAAWQAWLLIAGAAGAATWLFFVKVRPPKIFVPSLLLWRRVLDQSRALTWWERVRRAVSLAITVLVAITLALAVTRPGPRVAASSRGRLLLVLDSSWSMGAHTSGGRTRWQRAAAQANAMAQSAGEDVALATTADGLVEGPTSDIALIETALARLTPSGGDGAAWPRVGDADAVHFFTDGAVARVLDAGVVVHSVHEAAGNVAVTAFSVRPATSATSPGEAYLEFANYAAKPQESHLTVTRGTTVVEDKTLSLAAGEVVRQVVPLDQDGDPRLRVRISAPDNALEADDEAVAWMTPAETLRVIVVSADPGALAVLLQREPGVRASLVAPGSYRPGDEDIVIFDRWLPASAPGRPALILAPPSTSWLAEVTGEERTPRWAKASAHPVMAGVDPLSLDIKRARAYRGDLTPIAASERGTMLVAVADRPDTRFVVTSFALGESNLPMSPVFPVLVGNALEWLARPTLSSTGRPGPVEVPASTRRVLGPDGTAIEVMRAGGRAVAMLRTPGLYRVEAAGSHSVVGINVGAPDVSNLQRTTLTGPTASAIAGQVSGHPWWWYAVVLAFLVAVAEWATWQRRITV
jgi:hypothetical protein